MSSESQPVTWDTQERPTSASFVDPDAVFRDARAVLGRKWHPRIVYYLLEDGPMGFSGLKDNLDGISSKMLSESLSSLEDQALVAREVVSDQPIRVRYSLSERGASLEAIVDELFDWSQEYGIDTTEADG